MKKYYPMKKAFKNLVLLLVTMMLLAKCSDQSSYSNDNSPANGELNNTFQDIGETVVLTEEQKIDQEKERLISEGWQEQNIVNGQLSSCYNFKPEKGAIDNYLEVYVGSGTDVSIKVMNLETEKCVRYVFINSGSTFAIKNIPEGKYYLKIAYGKNWLSKVESGQCNGKFIRNPIYEKGEDIMDFNVKHSSEGYSIPSFKLQLDIIASNTSNSFNSQNISENEFNQ